jgi:ABC-type transport system involved in multi-copper enzyme maturation permease subunit
MSEQMELKAENFTAPAAWSNRVRTVALAILGIGAVGSAAAWFGGSKEVFLEGYLVGYLFWLSISLGGLALLMLQHLTSGAWGLIARRINEAAAGVLPLLLLFFVPIYLNLGTLYPWARPEAAEDHLLQKKVWWLNVEGFSLRVLIYFLLWFLLWFLLQRASNQLERGGNSVTLVQRMRTISGPGVLLFALAVTGAAIDFMMSTDPHWYSSLYGLYFLITCAIGGMAFIILTAGTLVKHAPYDHVFILHRRHDNRFHDWGKLLLAFVMVWAYFTASQLIIIWSGNLPEEITWYLHRVEGGWKYYSIAIGLLHFGLPFLLLLSRARKLFENRLMRVALLVLAMHWADYYWQIIPNLPPHEFSFEGLLLRLGPVFALGGLWLLAFLFLLKRRSLLPINDPYLPEALTHHE